MRNFTRAGEKSFNSSGGSLFSSASNRYDVVMRLRYLLLIPAFGFFIDALRHPYRWPGHYQPLNTRLIRLLWTHSREGIDMWIVLLCFLLIGLLAQRERALKDTDK